MNGQDAAHPPLPSLEALKTAYQRATPASPTRPTIADRPQDQRRGVQVTIDDLVAAVFGVPAHDCATRPTGPINIGRAQKLTQLHLDEDGAGRDCLHRQAGVEVLRKVGVWHGGPW